MPKSWLDKYDPSTNQSQDGASWLDAYEPEPEDPDILENATTGLGDQLSEAPGIIGRGLGQAVLDEVGRDVSGADVADAARTILPGEGEGVSRYSAGVGLSRTAREIAGLARSAILPDSVKAKARELAEELRQEDVQARDRVEDAMPEDAGIVAQGLRSGIQSLVEMSPGAILSAVTRNPGFVLANISATSAGRSYGDARAEGLEGLDAQDFAATQTGIELLTEYLPARAFTDIFGEAAKSTTGQIVRFMREEMVGEQAATLLQSANEVAYGLDEELERAIEARDAGEVARIIAERAAITAVATAAAGGGQVALGKAAAAAQDRLEGGTEAGREVGRELNRQLDEGVGPRPAIDAFRRDNLVSIRRDEEEREERERVRQEILRRLNERRAGEPLALPNPNPAGADFITNTAGETAEPSRMNELRVRQENEVGVARDAPLDGPARALPNPNRAGADIIADSEGQAARAQDGYRREVPRDPAAEDPTRIRGEDIRVDPDRSVTQVELDRRLREERIRSERDARDEPPAPRRITTEEQMQRLREGLAQVAPEAPAAELPKPRIIKTRKASEIYGVDKGGTVVTAPTGEEVLVWKDDGNGFWNVSFPTEMGLPDLPGNPGTRAEVIESIQSDLRGMMDAARTPTGQRVFEAPNVAPEAPNIPEEDLNAGVQAEEDVSFEDDVTAEEVPEETAPRGRPTRSIERMEEQARAARDAGAETADVSVVVGRKVADELSGLPQTIENSIVDDGQGQAVRLEMSAEDAELAIAELEDSGGGRRALSAIRSLERAINDVSLRRYGATPSARPAARADGNLPFDQVGDLARLMSQTVESGASDRIARAAGVRYRTVLSGSQELGLARALQTLYDAGFPETWMQDVAGVVVFADGGSAMGFMETQTGTIGLSAEFLRGAAQSGDQAIDMAGAIAHEHGHAEDRRLARLRGNQGKGQSLFAPELAVTLDEQGIPARVGPAMGEAFRAFAQGTELGEFFSYPLGLTRKIVATSGVEEAADFLVTEVYAQAYSVYYMHPELLRAEAPALYNYVEGTINELDQSRAAAGGVQPGAARAGGGEVRGQVRSSGSDDAVPSGRQGGASDRRRDPSRNADPGPRDAGGIQRSRAPGLGGEDAQRLGERPAAGQRRPGGDARPAGRDRQGDTAERAGAEAPRYGEPVEGAVSVRGRHYSRARRESLSGAFFGEGVRGEERRRLAGAPDELKQRVYFYVDDGSGIRPEPGVGQFAHEVDLDNIYDMRSSLFEHPSDPNAFELEVIRRGFDGYMAKFPGNQRAVVLLGPRHTQVPVAPVAADAGTVAAGAPPRTLGVRQEVELGREISDVKRAMDDIEAVDPTAQVLYGKLMVSTAAAPEVNRILAARGIAARAEEDTSLQFARVPDPAESRAQAVLSRLRGVDITPILRGEEVLVEGDQTLESLANALQQRTESSGIDLSEQTPENQDLIAEVLANETLEALSQDGNAATWYRDTVDRALAVAARLHPEIARNENAKSSFMVALAVTSNGQDVASNVKFAEKAYSHFKSTGRMPTNLDAGQESGAINSGFRLYNRLLEELGPDQTRAFLSAEYTVQELKAAGFKVTGDTVDTVTNGSAIFGPKIGGGFYQNLMGNWYPVTMDRWFMRTWGRVTGTIMRKDPERTAALQEKVREQLRTNSGRAAAEKLSIDVDAALENDAALESAARALYREFAKPDPKTKKTFTNRTKLNRAAKNLFSHITQPKDAPAGAKERKFIRETVQLVLKKLEQRGQALDSASVQALLWYPEKQLYSMHGVGNKKAEPTDYEQEFRSLARKRGVSERSVSGAVNAADRRRRALGGDEGGDGGAGVQRRSPGSGPVRSREARDLVRRLIIRQLRDADAYAGDSEGGAPSEIPQPFRRASGKARKFRLLDTDLRGVEHKPAVTAKNAFEIAGVYSGAFIELEQGEASARAFRSAITESKESNDFGAAVYVYEESEYADMRLFVSEDGTAGFALKGDDIVSVFSGGGGKGVPAMMLATQEGGRRLDAFDTVLPHLYSIAGFRVASRNKWDDEFAPEGWSFEAFQDYNDGRPDVVFMVYDPAHSAPYTGKEGAKSKDYDSAAKRQMLEVKRTRNRMKDRGISYSRRPSRGEASSYREALRTSGLMTQPGPSSNQFSLDDETRVQRFIRTWQDKLVRLKVAQKAITDTLDLPELPDEVNAYRKEELFHGKVADDLRDLEANHIERIADILAKEELEQGELDIYLYAKHAIERNAFIREERDPSNDAGSGMTDGEARAILQKAREEGKTRGLERAAQAVWSMLEENRQRMEDAGLTEGTTLDKWRERWPHYVPLRGFAESDIEVTPRPGKGYSIGKRETLAAAGRRTLADSPLLNSVQLVTEKIMRARKNEVAVAFLGMAERYPDSKLWSVYSGDETNSLPKERMVINGKTVERPVNPETATLPDGTPRFFKAKRDGKMFYVEIKDELLNTAMHNLGADKLTGATEFLVRTSGAATRMLSTLNTTLNPEFFVVNAARDVTAAVFNATAEQQLPDGKAKGKKIARSMMRDYFPAMSAFWRGVRGEQARDKKGQEFDRYYREFREDGAMTGWATGLSLAEQEKKIKNLVELAGGNKLARSKDAAHRLLRTVEDLNLAVENAVRLSAYKNARESGLSRDQAASLAKNLTVNFNRRGEATTVANSLYMFFNAAVQGNAQIIRSLANDPRKIGGLTIAQKAAAGMVGTGVGLTIYNAMVSAIDEDDESFYDKIPDWEKERNLIIMLPNGRDYVKIPLPYGYNVFHVLGVGVAEAFVGGRSAAGAAKLALHSVFDSFSPIGLPGSDDFGVAARGLAPTVAQPFLDLAVNENHFGSPIMRENFPTGTQVPDSTLSMRTTTEMAKVVAQFLNKASGGETNVDGFVDISPDAIEHLVGFATGGLGRFGMRSYNLAEKGATGGDIEIRDVPFLRQVAGQPSKWEDMGRYYDRRYDVEQVLAEFESRRGASKQEWFLDHRAEMSLAGVIEGTEAELRDIRKTRRELEQLPPSRATQQAIEQLSEAEFRQYTIFNRAYNRAMKRE